MYAVWMLRHLTPPLARPHARASRRAHNGVCRIEGVYPYALSFGFPLAHHAPRLTHPGSPPTPANRPPPLTTRLGVAGRREPCAQALSRRGQGVTERGAVPTEFCLADRGAAQQAGDRGRVRRAVLTPVSPTPVSPYRTETQLPPPPVAQHVAGADSAADHNPPIRD